MFHKPMGEMALILVPETEYFTHLHDGKALMECFTSLPVVKWPRYNILQG